MSRRLQRITSVATILIAAVLLVLGSVGGAWAQDGPRYIPPEPDRVVVALPLLLGSQVMRPLEAISCPDLLVNGDFEGSGGWYVPATAYSAAYSSAQARSTSRSMRMGITAAGVNIYSYSDAGQQVTIPASATQARLRFYTYALSSEPPTASLPAHPGSGMSLGAAQQALAGGSDLQYLLVLNQYGYILEAPVWERRNDPYWAFRELDLLPYRGQTIRLQWGVYNNGLGGVTAMYLDDVTLSVCADVPTPVPTWTPSPVPPPTNTPIVPPSATPTSVAGPDCTEGIVNGGIEGSGGWYIPATAYTAAISSERVRAGARAMRMGITSTAANKFSYSDAGQYVTIPAAATVAKLRFYLYPQSGETTLLALPEPPKAGASLAGLTIASDIQYLLVLNSAGTILDSPVWQRRNDRMWLAYEVNLLAYRGQTIRVHYGVYNDGYNGVTAMYLDDVSLELCQPGAATPVPTLTPIPGTGCVDALVNGGLESSGGWYMPITAYSAAFSTSLPRTGLWGMRMGIIEPTHNIYSYSDSGQWVSLPLDATRAKLRFYLYTMSGESTLLALPEPPKLGGQALQGLSLSVDMQYLLVLDEWGNILEAPIWQRRNNRAWVAYEFDLMRYAGRRIR
ncbi:MAG: hypothetical protein V1772_09055, partial [Chloroflexota bacterium]